MTSARLAAFRSQAGVKDKIEKGRAHARANKISLCLLKSMRLLEFFDFESIHFQFRQVLARPWPNGRPKWP